MAHNSRAATALLIDLSLFAAHAFYGLIGPATAFSSMFAVTLLGTLVAVLSGRLSTAVLAVLAPWIAPRDPDVIDTARRLAPSATRR